MGRLTHGLRHPDRDELPVAGAERLEAEPFRGGGYTYIYIYIFDYISLSLSIYIYIYIC